MRHLSFKIYLALTLMFLTTAFSVAYYSSPASSQQGTYFSDFFNSNAYDWTPTGGSWAVVEGRYTQTIDQSLEEHWSAAGSNSWLDYTVEAKVYSTDNNGTISLAGRWADMNNYYALEYNDSGTDNSASLTLYKKVNGLRVNLSQWNRSVNSSVYYIGDGAAPVVLKIRFSGANIDAYVNEIKIGSATDSSLFHGKIALGELNRQVYFDDIYVWDVTPARLNPVTTPFLVGNAATIEFSTDEMTSYSVDYGTSTSYGLNKTSTVRTVEHSVDINGLTPDTIYYYKVTVKDAGSNQTSTTGSFTTGAVADITPPAITDVVYPAVYITESKAVIAWQTNEEGNSIIDYGIASGSYKWSLSFDEKTTNHAVYLSGLDGLTRYYFTVKTRDVAGNLAVSPEYSLITLKNLKPKITAMLTGSIPSVNLNVYWKGIPGAVHYKVYVSPDNHWSDTPDAVIDETAQPSYNYQKLSLVSNTNYFVKVLAEDAVPDSGYTVGRAFPPDTNPHGYYWDNPDTCQNCHSTHTAKGARLIQQVNTNRLCVTCHDGSQSKYDVLRGIYKGPDNNMYESIAGPYGGLEGQTVEAVYSPTSRHDLDIYIYSATGNNIDNTDTADSNLGCGSCHDPHGSDNYRNLYYNMRVSLNTSTPPIIVEAYPVTKAVYEETTYVSGSVAFCGACHSDFNQGVGASQNARLTTAQPGMQLSAASMYMYMHPVNIDAQYVTGSGYYIPLPTDLPYENGKIICQTCHFTHGTTRTGSHTRRDGYSSTALKRFNETIGCENCHNKTDYPDK